MNAADVARLEEEERQRRMTAGINVAQQGRSPNAVAVANKLAKTFGVETALVESDPEPFKQLEARDKADAVLDRQPWMVPFLANNPDTAAMLQQDLPKMGGVTGALGLIPQRQSFSPALARAAKSAEPAYVAPKPRVAWKAKDYATRLPAAALGAFGEAVTNTAIGAMGAAEAVADVTGFNAETNTYFRQQQKIGEQTLKTMRPEWMASTTIAGILEANDVQSGLSSTVQMLLPLPFGKAAMLPTLAGVTAGQAYQKYQGRGIGIRDSLIGASAEGTIEYATERLPVGYLANRLSGNKAGHFLKDFVISDLVGEQLATLGQDTVDILLDPTKSTKDLWNWDQRKQAAISTLVATATTSGMVGGGLAAMNRLGRAVDDTRQSVEAMHGQAILDEVMKHAEGVELRASNPEEFAKFINEGAKGSPVKHVYVPVEAVDAALADETIPDEEKAALTVYQSQIDEARVTNGEIVIPIGEAAAHFAGTKLWQSLREDTRVLAGGISGREAKTQMDGLIEELEAIGNNAVEEARQLQPEIEAKANVYSDVKKQVLAAGRSEKEAQTTAAILSSRAEVLASKRGGFKDAGAAWKWMQLQVVGPDAKVSKTKAKTRKQEATVNIGLDVNDGSKLTVDQVVAALKAKGVNITAQEVRQSGTEPTLIAKLNRELTSDEAHALSAELKQDAIAQKVGDVGALHGPAAEKWGPFNPDYFLDLAPQTLQQSELSSLEQAASLENALKIARSKKFKSNRDFKLAMQDAAKAADTGDLRAPARLIKLVLVEARDALKKHTNAIGWYDDKVEKSLSVLSLIHPEIATEPNARFAFTYILAATSTGMEVTSNFLFANRVYTEFKRTKVMPEWGEGTGAGAMKKAFRNYTALLEKFGSTEALRDFMTTEHTVKEVFAKTGLKVAKEQQSTVVKGAAFMGPKIGNGYFSNLYGDFTRLTMDRWFMRTFGRYTGTLVESRPDKVKEFRTKTVALMRALTPEQKKQVEALLSDRKTKYKILLSDPEGFAKRVTLRTSKEEVREGLKAIDPTDRLRLDPKALYKWMDGQKEAPANGGELNEIRAFMGPVLTELQHEYPELTMADLQAVLWYPEKTLYDAAGASDDINEGYDDEAAPDYANAAVGLARSVGIDEEKINETVNGAAARVQARQSAARARRGAGRPVATAPIAEDQVGFPLEDVLSSEGAGDVDPTVLQQFGGQVGAFNDIRTMSMLEQAMNLEHLPDETVWEGTGWTKGAEGKWRFEIDDSVATMEELPSPEPLDMNDATIGIDYSYEDPTRGASDTDGALILVGSRLGKVLNHPKLFKFYPQLADMPVFTQDMPMKYHGFFDGYSIILNSNTSPEEQMSTLLHEVQHAIQTIEGFAGGATDAPDALREMGLGQELAAYVEYYRSVNKGEIPGKHFERELTEKEIVSRAAFAVYERVAGEVEARNTQTRSVFSAAERRDTFPDLTADFNRGQQFLPVEDIRLAASTVQQGPRGEATFYPSGKTIIQLFGKADFSTMLHEMSHVFLEQEFKLAQMESSSAEQKADVEKIKAWFAKHGFPVGEDGKIPVEAHELWARTGERYFREGKAPSAELRATFKQFREWLTGVYKSVKDLLAIGPAPINPEISEIFDRIIATDEAIEANATTPMTQEQLGMTTAEYDAYLDSVNTSRDAAHDSLLERMMKAIRRREQSRYRAERANIRAEVADQVNNDPRFIALHLLRTGRWLNDPSRERTEIKINTGWLIDNYGEDILKQLPVGLQPLHRGDGVAGDVVAELVGMSSGDQLVTALVEMKGQADALKAAGNPRPLRDQIIEDRTDALMAERHGDVAMDEKQIEEEAVAALNSSRQGEILAAELRQLRKINAKAGAITPYQLLREWARRKANESTVGEVSSKTALQRYVRAFNKARNLFEDAILGSNGDEAIKQKQAQMINHALLAEGKIVADEIGTIVRRMQRYAKTKAMASIDQDYMDRIHELLEGYNFRNVSDRARADQASFEEWADGQRELGHEVHVPARFRDNRTNWKDAQVAKLLELNDMVQSLAAQGKLKQRLTTARDERELQLTIDDVEGRILNLPPRTLPEASTGQESRPFRQALREAKSFADYRAAVTNMFSRKGARELASGLIKAEGLMDLLDGSKDATGPLNQHVVQPATEAANTFSRLLEEVMGPVIDRYKGMDRKQARRLHDFVTIPELTLNVSIHEADSDKLGKPLTIPRSKLLGLIANTGNLSNLSKLVAGERWGDAESATDLERVRQILISHASKEDLDLVQDMWNAVSKLWPHIVKVERELSGIVPEEVVPMPFEAHGLPYSGGYWPVVWDATRSTMGQKQGEEAETALAGVGFGIGTPKGHTITRTGAAAPMEWSLERVLFGHLNKVISRVAYAPWVRDALKVVDNPRVKGAIRLRMGDEYVKMIKPWMRDQIPSNWADTQGAVTWEKFLNATRVNMSIAVLGVSYSTGVAQTLGLGYSAGVLGDGSIKDGGKWMAVGIMKTLQLQKEKMGGAQEFVFARSEEMRRRIHEVNQESAEVFRRLKDSDSTYKKLQAAAFWHIGFIDLNMVSLPTWLGGYHKALSQGQTEEDAIAYAEKTVRLSQGSGRKKDLSAVQRGNAGQKFISMFYTPSSVFFNQQWEAAQHLKAGNWSNTIAPTFWFLVMTTLADAMREGDWPEDDDEDGLGGLDIGEWVARNILFGLFYGIPVARDVTNTAERQMRGAYAEYGTTPFSFAAETIARGYRSGKKIYEGDETEGKDIKNVAAGLGFIFGLPGNQLGKTTGFFEDVRTGKAQPDSVGDWYTGITSGKLPEQEQK